MKQKTYVWDIDPYKPNNVDYDELMNKCLFSMELDVDHFECCTLNEIFFNNEQLSVPRIWETDMYRKEYSVAGGVTEKLRYNITAHFSDEASLIIFKMLAS